MKRLLTTVIVTSLVTAGSLVATAGPGHTAVSCTGSAASFDGGTGTVVDPLKVSSQAQLELLHGLTYMACNFLQTADITLTGSWAPIGDHNDYFTGVYDGGGHSITGIDVTAGSASGGGQLLGLFGKIKGVGGVPAQVKDLSLAGTVTRSSGNFAGGLAGQVEDTLLTDVSSSVVLSVSDNAGGLVGQATGVTATRIMATGDVTGSNSSATAIGGLFGILRGTTAQPDVVQDAFATGLVTAGTASNGVGGFVGLLGNSPKVTFKNVYAIGHLTGGDGSVTQCFGGGMMGPPVCSTTTGTRGGLLAPNSTGTTYGADFAIVNSSALWNTQTTGAATTAESKGTGKTTAQMKSFDTYDQIGWSIANGYNANKTWGICESVNNGYPFLSTFYSFNPCLSPQLTNLDPAVGTTVGGTTVHINGADLENTVSVKFGGVNAASFTVTSTQITAVTPAGNAGSVDVMVRDGFGADRTLSAAFTYEEPPAAPPSAPTVADSNDDASAEPTPASTATTSPETVDLPPASSISPVIDTTSGQSMKTQKMLNSIVHSMPPAIAGEGRTVLTKHLPEQVTAKVRFITPGLFMATGDIARNRAVITPSGRVAVVIRSTPVNVLVTVKAPSSDGHQTVGERKLYRVR